MPIGKLAHRLMHVVEQLLTALAASCSQWLSKQALKFELQEASEEKLTNYEIYEDL